MISKITINMITFNEIANEFTINSTMVNMITIRIKLGNAAAVKRNLPAVRIGANHPGGRNDDANSANGNTNQSGDEEAGTRILVDRQCAKSRIR